MVNKLLFQKLVKPIELYYCYPYAQFLGNGFCKFSVRPNHRFLLKVGKPVFWTGRQVMAAYKTGRWFGKK